MQVRAFWNSCRHRGAKICLEQKGRAPRLMCPLSLSFDHRVVDGAAAARFTVYLGKLLSDVRRLIL